MLHCELPQDDLQPPLMVDTDRHPFFLHGPASCTHGCTRPVVPRAAAVAVEAGFVFSQHLAQLHVSMSLRRSPQAQGAARRARRGIAAARDARAMPTGNRHGACRARASHALR